MGGQMVLLGAIVALAGLVQLVFLRPWAKFASGLLESVLTGERPAREEQVKLIGRWVLIAIVAAGVMLVTLGVVALAAGTESP